MKTTYTPPINNRPYKKQHFEVKCVKHRGCYFSCLPNIVSWKQDKINTLSGANTYKRESKTLPTPLKGLHQWREENKKFAWKAKPHETFSLKVPFTTLREHTGAVLLNHTDNALELFQVLHALENNGPWTLKKCPPNSTYRDMIAPHMMFLMCNEEIVLEQRKAFNLLTQIKLFLQATVLQEQETITCDSGGETRSDFDYFIDGVQIPDELLTHVPSYNEELDNCGMFVELLMPHSDILAPLLAVWCSIKEDSILDTCGEYNYSAMLIVAECTLRAAIIQSLQFYKDTKDELYQAQQVKYERFVEDYTYEFSLIFRLFKEKRMYLMNRIVDSPFNCNKRN